jgi:chaperonin cofactor prefoldin
LSTQQLSQVKKQLDDELEHLTSSFTQLRAAQAKFRECLKSIASGISPKVEGGVVGNSDAAQGANLHLQTSQSWFH